MRFGKSATRSNHANDHMFGENARRGWRRRARSSVYPPPSSVLRIRRNHPSSHNPRPTCLRTRESVHNHAAETIPCSYSTAGVSPAVPSLSSPNPVKLPAREAAPPSSGWSRGPPRAAIRTLQSDRGPVEEAPCCERISDNHTSCRSFVSCSSFTVLRSAENVFALLESKAASFS